MPASLVWFWAVIIDCSQVRSKSGGVLLRELINYAELLQGIH